MPTEQEAQGQALGFTIVIANLIRELIIAGTLPEQIGLVLLMEADHDLLNMGTETSMEALKTVEAIRKAFLATVIEPPEGE